MILLTVHTLVHVLQDANDELKFTELLRHIYRRHANVVPVMAKVGLATLACLLLHRRMAQGMRVAQMLEATGRLDAS